MKTDQEIVEIAFKYKDTLPKPIASDFRVFAILKTVSNDLIMGLNFEATPIGSAICAERAALSTWYRSADRVPLDTVYVVTDSQDLITPGSLCREMLLEAGLPSLTVICATKNIMKKQTIGELYPYGSVYRNIERSQLVSFAQQIQKKALPFPGEWNLFYQIVYQKLKDNLPKMLLHPIYLAAGVLYPDGHIRLLSISSIGVRVFGRPDNRAKR